MLIKSLSYNSQDIHITNTNGTDNINDKNENTTFTLY